MRLLFIFIFYEDITFPRAFGEAQCNNIIRQLRITTRWNNVFSQILCSREIKYLVKSRTLRMVVFFFFLLFFNNPHI